MPNFKPEKLRVNLRLCINRLKLLEKKKSEFSNTSDVHKIIVKGVGGEGGGVLKWYKQHLILWFFMQVLWLVASVMELG